MTVTLYITIALLPIILLIEMSSAMLVAHPAMRNVTATPGAAPLATRAAMNGMWPTAQTYMSAATTVIPSRDTMPGSPR